MAPTPSIRIVKNLSRKGSVILWSNRYHFNGGVPADLTHWDTLADAIVADEKDALSDRCSIVEAIYYTAGSDLPVGSKTYSQGGALTIGSGTSYAPPDCAAVVRYSTTARSSKNHPIYLFNYFHTPIQAAVSGNNDGSLSSEMLSALQEYADDWLAGFSDGTNTYVRAGPNGATATSRTVLPYIGHRDFPR